MSMTETTTTPAAPKKRKYAARRKIPARVKPVSELAGITPTECPTACNAAGCVISGRFYCGHPYKGGLQGVDMHNDAAIVRLEAARKMLGKAKIKLPKL